MRPGAAWLFRRLADSEAERGFSKHAMKTRNAYAARLRLRYSGAATRISRLPLLGTVLRGIAAILVPRGTLVWARIQEGPARDSWILLDARGGSDFLAGTREPRVQRVIERWLAPDSVFYDVGANAGYFSLIASKRLGASGRIFAFEAEPDAASRLRSAIARNQLTRVTVLEKAVWSKSGFVKFDRGLGSPDRLVGHVTGSEESSSTGCVTVQAISLDEFMQSAPPPDVLKCDVEGAELEVFRGARDLLSSRRPKVVCEVHSPEILKELCSLLHQYGYRTELLDPEAGFPVHIVAEPEI